MTISSIQSRAAVVILNWNGKDFLSRFLPSVLNYTPGDCTVIVADNASTDDSVGFVTKNFPGISILRNKSNGGFAKGYNDALAQIKGKYEYYVLLNSDVEVTPNWMEPVIAMMDRDKNIVAVQPKILAFDKRDQFEYAGAAGGFIDKFGYPFCRGRIFNHFEKDLGQYNDTCEIFWATGACMFIRAEAYHNIGGLDEDFFAHMEEIDLCWRLKNQGYKIMYCPGSTVYHVGGGTLNKVSPRKTFLNFRNNLILLCKNHASRWFLVKLFLRFLLDGIAGIKFLMSGDASHCFAVVRAHFSFYSTFGKTLAKRNALKKEIREYSTTAIYRRSLVVDYYLRGKRKFSELQKDYF